MTQPARKGNPYPAAPYVRMPQAAAKKGAHILTKSFLLSFKTDSGKQALSKTENSAFFMHHSCPAKLLKAFLWCSSFSIVGSVLTDIILKAIVMTLFLEAQDQASFITVCTDVIAPVIQDLTSASFCKLSLSKDFDWTPSETKIWTERRGVTFSLTQPKRLWGVFTYHHKVAMIDVVQERGLRDRVSIDVTRPKAVYDPGHWGDKQHPSDRKGYVRLVIVSQDVVPLNVAPCREALKAHLKQGLEGLARRSLSF